MSSFPKVAQGAVSSAKVNWHRFPSSAAMVDQLRPTEPVYCVYPALLRRAAHRFLEGFPGRVLFAVKANPEPGVLQELHDAGLRCFDTASLAEIALVRRVLGNVECCFMAPCKLLGAAEAAFHEYGVRDFVADHQTEVERLLAFADRDTTIHIRMKMFDPGSVYELSSKFGAVEADAARLLALVARAGLRPGLAFNVGSLCSDPSAYARAILAAGQVANSSGVSIASLNVGGGFPTAYSGLPPQPLDRFFDNIRVAASEAELPRDCGLMCEPGRALVAEGQSLVLQVILIKDDMVFLNDGIYGNLKEPEISNGAVTYPIKVIRQEGEAAWQTRPCAISGPTCDSLDVLPMKLDLPADLREGDWIEFGLAGAYTNAMTTRFNGFDPNTWALIDDEGALPPGVFSSSDLG